MENVWPALKMCLRGDGGYLPVLNIVICAKQYLLSG